MTGNRLIKNEDGSRTTYTYDVANQLETSLDSTGTTTYTFDAAGNQQRVQQPDGSRTTTTWDFENQPTLYELANGSRVTMTYNADNRRTEKDSSTGTTKFLWEPVTDAYLMEADETDATQAVYTNEPVEFGRLVSQRRDNATDYYHFDGLGSTRELSDSSETVTDTYLYTAWGEEVASSGTTENPFHWVARVGYYLDLEFDSFYVRARVYDPAIARWESADPIGLEAGINLYRYSDNTPLLRIDPSGLKSTCKIAVHCWDIYKWGIKIDPIWYNREIHCGLSIKDCTGEYRLDGSDGSIIHIEKEPGIHSNVGAFKEFDPEVCKCLRDYPRTFNSKNLPRTHVQDNSNWALYCMVTQCGFSIDWKKERSPVGYKKDGACIRYEWIEDPGSYPAPIPGPARTKLLLW